MASSDWVLYAVAFIVMCSFIGAASSAIGNLMELYSDSFSSSKKSSASSNSAGSIASPLFTTSASTHKLAAMSFIAVKPLKGDVDDKQTPENEQKQLESETNDDDDVSPLPSSAAIRKQYYNGDAHETATETDEQSSTLALTYFLELQSRLQHLRSLVSTATKQAHGDEVDAQQFVRHPITSTPPSSDMLSELHAKNLKLIEGLIQSVVHDKSHRAVLEQERDFYDRVSPQPNQHFQSSYNSGGSGGSGGGGNGRRASLEQRVYESVEISLPLLAQTARTLWRNPQSMAAMTSGAVLYSSGVLFYCVQHADANASLVAYAFGVVCVCVVLAVGYLFSSSSLSRRPRRFLSAAALSLAVVVVAWRWIASSFNVTAAFILVTAVVLAFQYKHAPINARLRNLDELWMCLLLNCGLPLFAYYLQCPEMTPYASADVGGSGDSGVTMETSTLATATVSTVAAAAAAVQEAAEMMTSSVGADTASQQGQQTWMLYAFDLLWKLGKIAVYDFWQMLDLTYALDDVPSMSTSAGSGSVLGASEGVVNDCAAAAVSGGLEFEVQTISGGDVLGDGLVTLAADDSLYWFNKLFSAFPYMLFNVILVSWFVTHSSMLVRNLSQYKSENSKFLYCVEIGLAHVLSLLFWYNGMLTSTLLLAMFATLPWTLGLLKHVYDHPNIAGDASQMMHHTAMYNLWFFIIVYVSLVYDWMTAVGIWSALFSPNLLMVALPLAMIIQCLPQIVNEFVWATNF